MTTRNLVLGLILGCCALPALAAGTGLSPGQYRVTTIATGQTAPTVSYECLRANATGFFGLPAPTAPTTRCTVTRNSLADGRIDIARDCTHAEGVTSAGTVTGTHTDRDFTMHARITGGGLEAPLDVRAVGHRVAAACLAR